MSQELDTLVNFIRGNGMDISSLPHLTTLLLRLALLPP